MELTKSFVATLSEHLGTTLTVGTEIFVIGIIATLATDIWQQLLKLVAGVPSPNWGLVGRWVAWLPRGVFVHRPITATAPVQGEVAIGWAFHYAIGIVYAAIYLAVMRFALGSRPTLVSAMLFALALLIAPWFVMQPALGLGFVAARAPHPPAMRAINVSVHAVFGIGLYLGAIAWRVDFL
jgi:Protein of unknown function (DUF2938)